MQNIVYKSGQNGVSVNMAEFAQISRFQEENRKVNIFPQAFFTFYIMKPSTVFQFSLRLYWSANSVLTRGERNEFLAFLLSRVHVVFLTQTFVLVSLCAYFSEKYKQDYEKLEELLKTLPNRTTHEVMVRFVSCFRSIVVHSPSSFGPLFLFFLLFQCWCSVFGHLDHLL